MKKLLAIAMIAGSLITSVFAQERVTLNNVNLVIPVRNASGSTKGIGVDWHGFTFKNSSFGILTGCSFWIPLDLLSHQIRNPAIRCMGAVFRQIKTEAIGFRLIDKIFQ